MLTENLKAGTVSTRVIVIAIVLLIGIVTVGYGYVAHSERALIAGLLITIAGVIPGAFEIAVHGRE